MEGFLLVISLLVVVGAFWIWQTRRVPGPPLLTQAWRPGQAPPLLCGLEGSYRGQSIYVLPAPQERDFTIGRDRTNTVSLNEALVSRYHALISFQSSNFILYDRDSTNGTFVNDQRIAQHVLQDGDQIRIGSALFLFRMSTQPETSASVSSAREPSVAPVIPGSSGNGLRQERFEDYTLSELVGDGGMAQVYRAVSRSGQTVAIKILKEYDPYVLQKFRAEGEVARTLHHPNIIRVYDYGQKEGLLFIIMEYLAGGTLRDRLRQRGGALPLDDAVAVVTQICSALDYAHQLNIIHRDIKPENIMFGPRGDVKLVDFGIAKVTSATTKTAVGMMVGTPFYMSVEQAKADPVVPASDLYSLGVVFYEMVTGRLPFIHEDGMQVVSMHISHPPQPPRQLNPNLPPEIEKIILRSLDKDPSRRFPSARQMSAALGTSIHSPLPGTSAALPSRSDAPRHAARSPQLTVLNGNSEIVMVVPLDRSEIVLEREGIASADLYISSRHARLVQQDGIFWLQDLESRNGTFYNGVRIFQPVPLRSGDQIRIGGTVLRFES